MCIYLFMYLFIKQTFFDYFSPSTINNSSTTAYTKNFLTSTKYYSEISDDDLQSEATNASTLETFNEENSVTEDLNNGNH